MSIPDPTRRLPCAPSCRSCRRVAKAVVFGSRAAGDAEDRSDLDLAVSCPDIDARRWQEIAETIEDADTLIDIDLVWLEEASAALAEEIRRTGKVIYERA